MPSIPTTSKKFFPRPSAVLSVPLVFLALGLAAVLMSGAALAQGTVVQVASLNNQAAAAAEVDRLMSQGVPSFQRAEDVPGAGLRYRVYLGPFDSREEAAGAAEALRGSGLVGEYIVRSDDGSASALAGTVPAAPVAQAPVAQVPAAQAPAGALPPPPPPADAGGAYPAGETWPPLPGGQTSERELPAQPQATWPVAQPPAQPQDPGRPGAGDYWPPPPGASRPDGPDSPGARDYWPPAPGQTQAPVQQPADVYPAGVPASAPPQAQPGAAQISQPGAVQAEAGVPASTPVLGGGVVSQAPGEPALAPSAMGALTPEPAPRPSGVIPAKPSGDMKIKGFVMLADLSSSMRRLSPCVGGLVKQEAVNTLMRKMNQRIPSQPYAAALRVFGYKQAWTRKDYTTLYYGPTTYDREPMGQAMGRLFAADSISPFGFALTSSEAELGVMDSPKAVLMFADFEETTDPGQPADKARGIVRRHGADTRVYTYYVTRQTAAERLARDVAQAGGGKDYNVCDLLGDEREFEAMMTEIFGPADIPPCKDADNDGVCDEVDVCPSTPVGAPVDERGCWIAAYSQFFDFDKAEVKSAFLPRLQYAAELIVKNPQIGVVTIAGHTDAKGTDEYNMELGRKRAQAVRDILVKNGVPAERLEVQSFGKSRPIAENDTEEGRAKNRRVEFHVGDIPK
ncbi:MAG: OmpA family protein [Deltaproteobacteria bacterium]|jgi:OOP family OmpA-OmpF porin|nr:OmpA family protein [Deltaproteobacteria bacterium]